MVKFNAGVKAAAKMLAGLAPGQRGRVLELIASKDPAMAQALEKSLVQFNDLKLLPVKHLQELMREIELADLALGLRAADDALKSYLYETLPARLCQQLDDVLLGPPQSLDKVLAAQEKVLQVLRGKLERGELHFINGEDPFV